MFQRESGRSRPRGRIIRPHGGAHAYTQGLPRRRGGGHRRALHERPRLRRRRTAPGWRAGRQAARTLYWRPSRAHGGRARAHVRARGHGPAQEHAARRHREGNARDQGAPARRPAAPHRHGRAGHRLPGHQRQRLGLFGRSRAGARSGGAAEREDLAVLREAPGPIRRHGHARPAASRPCRRPAGPGGTQARDARRGHRRQRRGRGAVGSEVRSVLGQGRGAGRRCCSCTPSRRPAPR